MEWYVPELKMPVKVQVREYYREPLFYFPNYIHPGEWLIHELTAMKRSQ